MIVNCKDFTHMTIVLLLCLAKAGDPTCTTAVDWVYSDKTLTVTGTGAMCYYSSSPEDFPWYSSSATMESVIIQDGVTTIDQYAFYNYQKLKVATIANTVTEIGQYAFYKTAIESIDIPGSVKLISDWVFSECASLSSIVFGEGLEQVGKSFGWVFSKTALTEITFPATLTKVLLRCFSDANGLEAIHVHEDNTVYMSVDGMLVNRIEKSLFVCPRGRKTQVEIPSYATKIGSEAFYGCTEVPDVVIHNEVTSILSLAFQDCTSLREIFIPSSVTTVGDQAFCRCTSLESAVISTGITAIPQRMFSNTGLKSVVIPDSVTSIYAYAFTECACLAAVTLPAKLQTINNGAFKGCIALTGISIPGTVKSFGKDVFVNCTQLTEFIYEGVSDPNQPTFMVNTTVEVVKVPWNYQDESFCGIAIERRGKPTDDYDIQRYTARDKWSLSFFIFAYIMDV